MPTTPPHFDLSLFARTLRQISPGTQCGCSRMSNARVNFLYHQDGRRAFYCLGTLSCSRWSTIARGLAFKVHGPIALTETGVLSALAAPLAEARISLLAISTFDTDYLLVASGTISAAVRALERSGHRIHRSQEE